MRRNAVAASRACDDAAGKTVERFFPRQATKTVGEPAHGLDQLRLHHAPSFQDGRQIGWNRSAFGPANLGAAPSNSRRCSSSESGKRPSSEARRLALDGPSARGSTRRVKGASQPSARTSRHFLLRGPFRAGSHVGSSDSSNGRSRARLREPVPVAHKKASAVPLRKTVSGTNVEMWVSVFSWR